MAVQPQQDISGILLQAAEIVEKEVDKRLEELKEVDDLSALRAQRLAKLKKQQEMRQKWLAAGHGKLNEITDEKEFFAQTKECERGLVHFHRPSSEFSDILGTHLRKIAELHIECKFVQINAEKAPFLTERLNIKIIPTLLIIEKGQTAGKIEGLDGFGGVRMNTYKIEKALHKIKLLDDVKTSDPDNKEEDDYDDDEEF
ncbi:putative ATP binding protein associated with cell differentiation [Monocercomonoides exilis]|uniref:putative ATP binding protein associated with cell differentiation n=1 Tax=Monocercomonoides exilis TaxID=2049356 RepID=UPI003559FFF1|nr:putative ATP binding protein associated with cell differentiation [Monocercomonoides exilis]|eukprot:MONOS_3391.1-p1 / transcript=MONOS_3391.1 / gene=MONOS_3391 / organism=Monocercomonoides_exilis_PA203 / gene_product=ATP binding protein associated with cell differentiation / transcript_product=ATP binding protein associated with cell differentiation / location=Mono_scaffold00079:117327-118062(-) / protein_length=199 / sequence_SO=supercontig / SO=protein_coding / is_pseudo=false